MYNKWNKKVILNNAAKMLFVLTLCIGVFAVIYPNEAAAASSSSESNWQFWQGSTEKPYKDIEVTAPKEDHTLDQESTGIKDSISNALSSWWEKAKSVGRAAVNVTAKVAQTAGNILGLSWSTDCPDADKLTETYSTCTICDVFSSLFYGISYVSQEVYNTISSSATKLLAVFAVLWLALEVLKVVVSITPIESGEFFKKILLIVFKVGIVSFALMGGPSFVFDNIIGPIIEGGSNFGILLLGGEPDVCSKIESLQSGALPAGVHQSFRCLFEAIYETISRGFVYGHALICYATNGGYAGEKASLGSAVGLGSLRLFSGKLSLSLGPSVTIPDWSLLISGCVFYVFAFLVILILPFYLIDSILKLGIAAFMMPVLMVAWVFPMTSWFAKKGFDMILACVFTFIMTAMVVSINVALIDAAINNQNFSFDELHQLINQGRDEAAIVKIKDYFDFSSSNMLAFIAAHLWAFLMFGKIGELAGHFVMTVGGSFSNRVGGIAVRAAKKTVTTAYRGAKELAMSKGADPMQSAKQMAKNAKKTADSAKKVADSAVDQAKETGKAAATTGKALGKAGAEIGKAGAQAGGETAKNAKASAKTAVSGAKAFGVGLLVTVPLAAVQFGATQTAITAKFAAKSAVAMAKAAAKIAKASVKLAVKTAQNSAKMANNSAKTVSGAVGTVKNAPNALRSKPWRKDKKKA
ncbi:MAG: hypothetical protein AB7U85_03435 [Alphaproteobacteria bacterium]